MLELSWYGQWLARARHTWNLAAYIALHQEWDGIPLWVLKNQPQMRSRTYGREL